MKLNEILNQYAAAHGFAEFRPDEDGYCEIPGDGTSVCLKAFGDGRRVVLLARAGLMPLYGREEFLESVLRESARPDALELRGAVFSAVDEQLFIQRVEWLEALDPERLAVHVDELSRLAKRWNTRMRLFRPEPSRPVAAEDGDRPDGDRRNEAKGIDLGLGVSSDGQMIFR